MWMYYERNDQVNSIVVPVVYRAFSAWFFFSERPSFFFFFCASCFLSTSQAGTVCVFFQSGRGTKTFFVWGWARNWDPPPPLESQQQHFKSMSCRSWQGYHVLDGIVGHLAKEMTGHDLVLHEASFWSIEKSSSPRQPFWNVLVAGVKGVAVDSKDRINS